MLYDPYSPRPPVVSLPLGRHTARQPEKAPFGKYAHQLFLTLFEWIKQMKYNVLISELLSFDGVTPLFHVFLLS